MEPPLQKRPSGFSEGSVWMAFGGGWRRVYGDFQALGISLEIHDFVADQALDWGHSFHPDSIEICVNLNGRAEVGCRGRSFELGDGTSFYLRMGAEPIRAVRHAGERHRFVSVECRRDFLLRTLAGCEPGLEAPLRESLVRDGAPSLVSKMRPLTEMQIASVERLWKPEVPPCVLSVWFHSKVLELIAEHLFPPAEELFCSRHKRVMRDKVGMAVAIIERDLVEPPPLDAIAREVGASPFHLSRTFSEEMRMTIPQFVRQRRIERAAEMIRAGTHNVTEAAFAVGYSSLGHFSKAFGDVFGCRPSELNPPTV